MRETKHFKPKEFFCSCCGKGESEVNQILIDMLEKLHTAMNANAIYITSGYRCPKHDKAVGGSGAGMHTLGGAADIVVYRTEHIPYSSFTVAREAEKIGFTGIGIISNDACHVDIRGKIPYVNNHWFGNELTGETYTTFAGKGEKITNTEACINCPHCGKKIKVEKGE